MRKRILITGAAGFFGHHMVEHVLKSTDWDIVGLIRVGRIGNLRRLTDIEIWKQEFAKDRIQIVWHDLRSPLPKMLVNEIGGIHYIVHAAASTHVDQSILYPERFVMDNVLATAHMLQFARQLEGPDGLERFHYFSTDEVTGPAPPGVNFAEDAQINPTNPYSATKLGAEALVNAFGNTYGLPVFTTRTMNLIGERCGTEKFLMLIIKAVLAGEEVVIHSDATRTVAGQRHYLHCRNAAAATLFLLEHAEQRNIYNVVGDEEVDNLTFARMIADVIGKPLKHRMVDFHSSRPGHDLRYALDGSKLKAMGFKYPVAFADSLHRTVEWTLANPEWLEG